MEAKREYMCKERIVDLEFKISRLGLLGKAYYDLVQIKLKRHRNQIATARTQNMLLHAALDTLRHKATIARKNLGDLENLRKTVASLRVTYDHQRNLVFLRQKKLEAQVTDTHSAELECARVLDPNTPDLVRIRRLEAMLNAIRLKTKDVQILMRHYEATLKPMKEEYSSYSAKLEAVRNILNIKNAECEKLINSNHDAIRARDASKKELEELIGKLFGKDGRDMVSPEVEKKILAAIKEIKDVMEVRSMREMYHQFILQEKQSAYLQSIYVELKRTVDQLKNDYPPRRKSSMQPHAVHNMIEGTKLMVRRQSSRKGSIPLLQILDGTQKLVERLHEGNLTMPSEEGETKEVLTVCQERISNLVQALHRKIKYINREAHRKAKEDAKAAGQAYVREARFAEFDAEADARKAAKEKYKAEIRREIEAREAEARRKEEEKLAAREDRRAQIRAEMDEIREKSRKEAEEQAEALRKLQKEYEPARASKSGAVREKSIRIADSITHSVVASGSALGGESPEEPAQKGPEGPVTAEVSSSKDADETDAKIEDHPTTQAQTPKDDKTEETPPVAEKVEATEVAALSSSTSEVREEVPTVAGPSTTEPEIQLRDAPSSTRHGETPLVAERVEATEVASPSSPPSEAKEEVPTVAAPSNTKPEIQLRDAPSSTRHEENPPLAEKVEGTEVVAPSSPPSEAKEGVPMVAAPSTTEPEIQLRAAPSSTQHEAKMDPTETAPAVMVTFTSKNADTEDVQIHLLAALPPMEDEEKMDEEVASVVPVPSTPEHLQPSEEDRKLPDVQSPATPSSSEYDGTGKTAPAG